MIINALSTNASTFILYFFNIAGKVKRFIVRKDIIINTQLEANKSWENPEGEIPYKYSYIMKTIWLTAFYSPLVPIVVPVSIAGLIFNYWIEKCLYGNTYKAPNMISSMVNEVAIELLEYFPLILSVGEFLIYFYFYNYDFQNVPKNYSIPIYVAFGISLINIALPMDRINRRIFHLKIDEETFPSYKDVENNFEVTYDWTNPVVASE